MKVLLVMGVLLPARRGALADQRVAERLAGVPAALPGLRVLANSSMRALMAAVDHEVMRSWW